MKKPIAVVTGGAGFIGSHMVDGLIQQNYAVRVIDNLAGGRMQNLAHLSNCDFIFEQRDIRDIREGDPLFSDARYVFHFAGIGDIVPSIEHPRDYLDINVQGTVRVLEAARHAKVQKFVYAASSSCYGIAEVPTHENHPVRPLYPYALSKYMGEMAALHWHEVYRLPVNSIRIFNAYGLRSRTSGAYGAVFGVFLRQKLSGHPFTVVGDGTQRRDFVHVSDVARAFLAAAQTSLTGKIWNVGAGNPQTVNRLVELLEGPTVHIPERPGEPDCTWADISKIILELGWLPLTSFETGVRSILDNIDCWRDAPLWTPEKIASATAVWFDCLSPKQRELSL